MDLYTLFVEQIFGGFWIATIGLSMIFLLMLAFGGVSAYSIGLFLMVFFLAMALGYGLSFITVPIFIFIFTWSVLQIIKGYDN